MLTRRSQRTGEQKSMAHDLIPRFVNDRGVPQIRIGVKEFQCMGASPPYDHPHVYLDMGTESEIVCPYCSTLFVFDARLQATETEPGHCVYKATAPAGERPCDGGSKL
jgi:uncharacterized Zn-finger protein